MKAFRRHIRQSLSWQLSLGILMFVTVFFMVNIGFLFVRARQLVKNEAIERAVHSLECTALQVRTYMDEVEAATTNMGWLVQNNLNQDSLLNYTHRVVMLNPLVNGCSITLEPGVLPGREAFSAYSVRMGNMIETAVESDYDYYSKPWYRQPKKREKPCWVDPYNDFTPGTLSSPVMIASYGQPVFSKQDPHKVIGIISTDLSVAWLFQVITAQQPYPHAYCVLLGADGHYFVHPDPLKRVKESIFTAHDDPTINALGKSMVKGQKGSVRLKVDGESCFVCYQPIAGTRWSIALLCPEREVYQRYNQQTLVVLPILIVGLLLILFLCRNTIVRFLMPLKQLAKQTHHVANGHFDEHLEPSTRQDVVGRLQNNFITMRDNIAAYLGSIQRLNAEAEERNRQLAEANQLVQEANQRMTDFVHEMSHQMRTPLNHIVGFVQLLQEGLETLPAEERSEYVGSMWQSSLTIKRMAHMLFDVSWLDGSRVIDLSRPYKVNDVVRDAVNIAQEKFSQGVPIELQTTLDDEQCIHTNRLYLYRLLRELLFNAKKFADKGTIRFSVHEVGEVIRCVVEDDGPGIAEADREKVFEPFVKLNPYVEGLGLGLGLSRKIAKKLKGSLLLDPDYTAGARFVIDLPNS